MKTVKKIIFSFILFVICFSLFSTKAEAFISGITDSQIWNKWNDTKIYYIGIDNKDGEKNKTIGVTVNKYSTANETLFCIDSHLDGPSTSNIYLPTSIDDKLAKAYLEIYKYYMTNSGSNTAYITANIATRLITLEYNTSKVQLKVSRKDGRHRVYGPGSQFDDYEWNPIKVYQNTLDIVNELLKTEGNNIDYGSSLDSFFTKYENKNSQRSLSSKGFSGEGNDGKGILKNAILQYINAKKKYEESSNKNATAMPNIDVSTTLVEAVENGSSYIAEFTVQASGFKTSEGEYTNPKVEKIGNTYTSIQFIEQPAAGVKYDKTSVFKVRVTISKDQMISAGQNQIKIPFKLSFQFTSNYSLSNVYVAEPRSDQISAKKYPLQRMLIFKNTIEKSNETLSKDLTITVNVDSKNCDILTKEDGTKEYYDLNGTLINKGSEEANLEEYNRVCKLCFQSPELDPNSPEFNKEMFDKRGCCNMFDPDDIYADPGHKEYYNKFCARMCYVTPELNPDSYEFDQSAFEEECCDMPPTNAAQLEHYNTYCGRKDPCTPTIDLPYCSDASSSISTVKESDDWDRCIFNNKDVAGNPYNISGYENNPYCKIACKEEYEITYPGKINNIRAGQYFVLTTGISGKRTCKTTEIRNDKFESDVEDLIDDVLEAYNDWIYYYKAAAATASTSSSSCKSTGREEVKCTKEMKENGDCTEDVSACEAEEKTTCSKVSFTWTYTTYSIVNGRLVPDTKTETKSTGGTNPSECSCTCDSVTYPSDYEAERDRLKVTLDNKINALNNAFNYIRSCSSFNNNFNFDPDISLTYEEDYYMNMIRQLPNGNSFIPSEDAEIKTDVSHYVGTQNYGDSSQTKTVRKIACNANGCSFINETVPKNTRIEKVATVDQTMYKPATVFYSKLPTGEMKGFQNGNKPNPEKDYVKVGQVFPIAMTTEEGTYNYTITYGNLGQYNDDNSTGRITGYSNSVYEALGYSNEYVCNYNIVEDICLDCIPNPDPNPNPSGGKTLPGGFAYFYRPISLYDVFPNSKVDTSGKDYLSDKVSRTIGKNWTSVKGVFTQKRIEENNAEAYEKAEYSYTLTPANMMAIREYNKTHQYNDFDLVCREGGINCTSTFLDEGAGKGYFTENERNTTFIPVNGDGDTPKGLEICDVGETNSLSCVGPSWK